MTIEEIRVICWAFAMVAQIFSWTTILTENWWFYIPTVLFALGTFVAPVILR